MAVTSGVGTNLFLFVFHLFQSRPQVLSPHGFLNSWPDVLGAPPWRGPESLSFGRELGGIVERPAQKHFFLMCQASFGLYM